MATVLQLTTAWVDLDSGQVARTDADEVRLTSTERALLTYLADHPDEDLARERLLADVWGYREGVTTRTLDTTIKTLRRKIEADPRRPNHIHTVWGIGYRFSALSGPRRIADLVGRDDLVDALHAALDGGARLITFTGPGGIGKTRLADEATRDRPRVCFVPLADAREAAGIEAAVAERLPAGPTGSLERRLAVARPLLVLDNLEQVLEPARTRIAGWLQQVPALQIVATSRSPLRLPEETILEVGPLNPADALTLFRRRLDRLRPELAEVADEVLSGIVDALDGLPLAIELAAGRSLVLTPEELRERLHAPAFLSRRDGVPRHRSIESVVGWSWDLLPPAHQAALAACSAFVGSFTATDAEALLPADDDRLEVLEALFEASLLTRTPDGRLAMLDLVRRFAEARLSDPAAVWARHAAYVLSVTEDSVTDRRAWSADLRAVLSRCADHPALVCRAAMVLSSIYATTLPSARAVVTDLAVAAARRSGQATLRADAEAERGAARLAMSTSTFDDHAVALGHALRTRDPVRQARVFAHLGTFFRLRGRLEGAERWLGEARGLLDGAGQARAEAVVLSEIGLVERLLGRPEAALTSYQQAMARCAAAGDDAGAANAMQRVGACHLGLGDQILARHWLNRALEQAEAIGSRATVLTANGGLAWLEIEAGHPERAIARLEQMARWVTDQGTVLQHTLIEANLALAWLEAGALDRARVHADRAVELAHQRPGYVPESQAALTHALVVLATEPAAGVSALGRAVERCRAPHPAVELVFSLGYLAASAPGRPDTAEAERLAATSRDHAALRFVEVLRVGLDEPARSTGGPTPGAEDWVHPRRLRALLLGRAGQP